MKAQENKVMEPAACRLMTNRLMTSGAFVNQELVGLPEESLGLRSRVSLPIYPLPIGYAWDQMLLKEPTRRQPRVKAKYKKSCYKHQTTPVQYTPRPLARDQTTGQQGKRPTFVGQRSAVQWRSGPQNGSFHHRPSTSLPDKT